jgi:hypothetical protein
MAKQSGKDTIQNLLATIHEVVSNHTSSGCVSCEPLLLAVGMQQTVSPSFEITNEEWQDFCMDCGSWEWIDGELDGKAESERESKKERNEFGGRCGLLTQQRKRNGCICAESVAPK